MFRVVCEPAGPGFDNDNEEPKLAGKNVQCIHTSIDLGTTSRKCHQDWLMGNCGISQPAAGTYTNHGMLMFQCCFLIELIYVQFHRSVPTFLQQCIR